MTPGGFDDGGAADRHADAKARGRTPEPPSRSPAEHGAEGLVPAALPDAAGGLYDPRQGVGGAWV
jgi:hypothetical protein